MIAELELKEFIKLAGWPREMAQEILAARQRIRTLEDYVKSLHAENTELKALLRAYASDQMKMINEIITLRKEADARNGHNPEA